MLIVRVAFISWNLVSVIDILLMFFFGRTCKGQEFYLFIGRCTWAFSNTHTFCEEAEIKTCVMKNPFAVICLSLLWLISLSCNKKDAASKIPPDPVAELTSSASFQDFGLVLIPSLIEIGAYHHQQLNPTVKQVFLKAVEQNSHDLQGLAEAYRSAGLNLETAVAMKNRVDAAVFKLMQEHRFLAEMDPVLAEKTIFQAMDLIIRSEEPRYDAWKVKLMDAVRSRLSVSGNGLQPATNALVINYMAPKLTLSEVWNCLVEAAGFGTAGVLGIGGLQKLAKEGIQEIIVSLSKFLAKNAGWFGLALTIFQLADCIYSHITD